MGKPAARIGDMHMCPMVTPGLPPIPHVGGPITGPGCPTVLIGGMPAAVMGDMCTCVGPPATVVLGSTGVFIGGKPAARMGDMTAHGGSITVGCPTVLIGETIPGGIIATFIKSAAIGIPLIGGKAVAVLQAVVMSLGTVNHTLTLDSYESKSLVSNVAFKSIKKSKKAAKSNHHTVKEARALFVKKYFIHAIKATEGTGILPETLICQMMLESAGKSENGYYLPGNSGLSKKHNNFFGVKAIGGWKGKSVNKSTKEFYSGSEKDIKDNFRVYDSPEDSINDYVSFLTNNPRYKKAKVFEAKTIKEQTEAIKNAGYATDPKYSEKVLQVYKSVQDSIAESRSPVNNIFKPQ